MLLPSGQQSVLSGLKLEAKTLNWLSQKIGLGPGEPEPMLHFLRVLVPMLLSPSLDSIHDSDGTLELE